MRPTFTLVAALLVGIAASADAQDRWALDVRGGPAVSVGELGDTGLGTGLHLDTTIGFRVQRHLGGYLGWSWLNFGPDVSFAGPDTDIEEMGYAFGVRFEHPLAGETGDGPALRIRIGGTWNHLEVFDRDGHGIVDSGFGLGWETGAALTFPFGNEWRFSPGVRYRSLSRDVTFDGQDRTLDLRYVTFEGGLTRSF